MVPAPGQGLEVDLEDLEARAEDLGVEAGDPEVKIGTEEDTAEGPDLDQDLPEGRQDQDLGKEQG